MFSTYDDILLVAYLVLKNDSFIDCKGVVMFGVDGGVHGIDDTSSLMLLPFDGCRLFIELAPNLSGNREKSEKCEYPPND